MTPPAYVYRATITRVIDGDTAEACVDLGFRVSLAVTLRLAGINAPETRGPSRAEGERSRARLRELVEGKEVTLDSRELDKYGRSVAVIHRDGVNVNALMLREGLAVPYMGDPAHPLIG